MRNQIIQSLQGKRSYSVSATHRYNDVKGKSTAMRKSWKWDERESTSAQKAFQLSGPMLRVLANGGVWVIDEMEAKMHPIIILNTINTFLNAATNPNHAQLVFATHDTNLLSYTTLRRDQIYFAEKNNRGSAALYSLADFVYFGEKMT